MSNPCCKVQPVSTTHESLGTFEKIGDMSVYITGPKTAEKAIIVNYDIFGDHPNTRQVADIISTFGYIVAIPDLCRGEPWDVKNWPPPSFEAVMAQVHKHATFDNVKKDFQATAEYLKKRGATRFGLLGFCWGGVNVALLSENELYKGNGKLITAAAAIHPGTISAQVAEKVKSPICILLAENDPKESFSEAVAVLEKKNLGLVYKQYLGVTHGFCAALSNFADEVNAKRTNEALVELHSFYSANL